MNKRNGRWFSIKQNGKTVAHSTALCIRDCSFEINQNAQRRVIKNKKKEPHAYIVGFYCTHGMGRTAKSNDLPVKVHYDPFKNDYFIGNGGLLKNYNLKGAHFIVCNNDGVRAIYTY